MMVGRVIEYIDLDSTYLIKSTDENFYCAYANQFNFEVQIGDVVSFECTHKVYYDESCFIITEDIFKQDKNKMLLFREIRQK